jgi:hypothetical protein
MQELLGYKETASSFDILCTGLFYSSFAKHVFSTFQDIECNIFIF